MAKWIRYRFETKSIEDWRPLIYNPKYPSWCSGFGSDYATIVAYLPVGEDLKKYWDDAENIIQKEENEITFTDRFPRPDDYTEF